MILTDETEILREKYVPVPLRHPKTHMEGHGVESMTGQQLTA
jgi:hypothetical protein